MLGEVLATVFVSILVTVMSGNKYGCKCSVGYVCNVITITNHLVGRGGGGNSGHMERMYEVAFWGNSEWRGFPHATPIFVDSAEKVCYLPRPSGRLRGNQFWHFWAQQIKIGRSTTLKMSRIKTTL